MCKFCQELIECPVGQKRSVIVEYPKQSEVVDYYGLKHHIEPTKMHIDKWPDGHIDCFIKQDAWDENNVQHGFGLDITHCPYCGENLV